MDLLNIFDDAKKAMAELRRDKRYKQQNKERRQAVELLDALAKCRGKLEICRTSFDRSIRTQSRYVQEGLKEGMDTLLQEQTLWDAAMGYLLVRDAMFALKSINTYDSVEHAYELLDEAVKIMSGKAKPKDSLYLGKQRERDAYGFITSNAALRQKEEMLDSFFSELKQTGDIEECIEAFKEQHTDGNRQRDDELDELLNRIPVRQEEETPERDEAMYSMDVPPRR